MGGNALIFTNYFLVFILIFYDSFTFLEDHVQLFQVMTNGDINII